jgi:cation-transporting P-type ATPase 13A2
VGYRFINSSDNVADLLNAKYQLTDSEVEQRVSLFGKNSIDIEEKSNFRLLVDEVLHPFFVFQICSIILWSLDSYYYYAACIFIISTLSAIFTLVETKRSISRLKHLSKFSCQVRLWRNGAWSYWKSEDMGIKL